jgi:hypothetical protein
MKDVRSRAEHHQPAATNKRIVRPALTAGQLNIDGTKAEEITAYLGDNPSVSLTTDHFNPWTKSTRTTNWLW